MNQSTLSNFLISATTSGSGKTTLTLGILRALSRRGISVQPFKCGPDYIDTKYHDLAAGNPSINIDTFFSTSSHLLELFSKHSLGKQVSVVEGVMGLYDGYNRIKGSSADIAQSLSIPVVLVIPAKAMAHSAAALLYGFKHYYPQVNIVGAIFNFVRTASHYNYLQEACKEIGIEPLGYLPPDDSIAIPSRHLGLTLDTEYQFEAFVDKVASFVEKHIDINRLLQITQRKEPLLPLSSTLESCADKGRALQIAVAYDEAFNFIYHENINALKRIGKVTYFSPIRDTRLPKCDMVYLPGGYPELYLTQLSENTSMKHSIYDYIESQGRLLAECGGMMYLSKSITDKEGVTYPMVGIFQHQATLEKMKLSLGYRQMEYRGQLLKGHEFHYSSLINDTDCVEPVVMKNARDAEVKTKLFRYKNAVAGYMHIYWADKEILKIF